MLSSGKKQAEVDFAGGQAHLACTQLGPPVSDALPGLAVTVVADITHKKQVRWFKMD